MRQNEDGFGLVMVDCYTRGCGLLSPWLISRCIEFIASAHEDLSSVESAIWGSAVLDGDNIVGYSVLTAVIPRIGLLQHASRSC